MHGSIFYGFKQFVIGRHGHDGWNATVDAAHARGWYHATSSYPDEELEALVKAAGVAEGRPVSAVWEDFGAALVPNLVAVYRAYLSPTWRTLDLLENVEKVIHRTVRMQDQNASHPHLRPTRTSPMRVDIEYVSARRLCSLAMGICRGVAAHFGDTIAIEHQQCMLTGSASCLIVVRQLVAPAGPRPSSMA